MADTTPPTSISGWLKQVNEDPTISPEYRDDAEDQLWPSSTSFSSGFMLSPTENLLLRPIWHSHPGTQSLQEMMTDNSEDHHTGYISAENQSKAKSIFSSNRSWWQPYLDELELRAAGQGTVKSVTPLIHCGDLHLARQYQLLALAMAGDEEPTTEYLERTSSIWKPELDPARGPTFTRLLDDQHYVNMALVLLLSGVTLGVGDDCGTMDWLPSHLYFQLMEEVTTRGTGTEEDLIWMRELVIARVLGYLSRRAGPFQLELNTDAAAILDAKPFTRSSARTAIRRQEGAQMACWISKAGDTENGLLKTSTCGRKRRVMISQDRHEIFVIVAEYGAGYEQHIRPRSIVQGSAEACPRVGETCPESPITPASIQAESPGKDKDWVPDAGDFLIMNEFGPFLTTDAGHMEELIKQVIALMLQLRGAQARFIPKRTDPDFLLQSHGPGLPMPTESPLRPRPALKKAYSWPGMVKKSKDWEIPFPEPNIQA